MSRACDYNSVYRFPKIWNPRCIDVVFSPQSRFVQSPLTSLFRCPVYQMNARQSKYVFILYKYSITLLFGQNYRVNLTDFFGYIVFKFLYKYNTVLICRNKLLYLVLTYDLCRPGIRTSINRTTGAFQFIYIMFCFVHRYYYWITITSVVYFFFFFVKTLIVFNPVIWSHASRMITARTILWGCIE